MNPAPPVTSQRIGLDATDGFRREAIPLVGELLPEISGVSGLSAAMTLRLVLVGVGAVVVILVRAVVHLRARRIEVVEHGSDDVGADEFQLLSSRLDRSSRS